MATRYVRSTDGNNADDGSTFALAKADLAGVAAIDAAGDRIWVSDNHAESTAGAVTIALAGTMGSPTQVLCGDDAAEPPTALATSGTVTTTGANGITITGNAYTHGLSFNCSTGATSGGLILAGATNNRQVFDSCNFSLVSSAAGQRLQIGQTGGNNTADVELIDCGIKFGATGQQITVCGTLTILGGSALAGGSNPTTAFNITTAGGGTLLVDGFDFSNWASTLNLATLTNGTAKAIFRNCKLPAGWTGSLLLAAPTVPAVRAEMWNCDSGDTNYRMWIEDYAGSIKSETTLVKTGGASDGDTPLSWKMVTNANASFPLQVLRSPEIFSGRITTVGAPKTITVDILHDSVTNLKDDEIWLEVQFLGTSGFPLSLFADDAKTDVLAAAADQAASSATWTTTGMGNPNKQKLEVTFTPQEEGVAIATVCRANASYTVYVDRVAQVS